MKNRNILSGIAALLMVGTFYSFAFCMVEDVDSRPVPMEYYYSTETDAGTGERNGEATSAFDAAKASYEAARPDEDRYHYNPDAAADKSVTAPPEKKDEAYGEVPAAPVNEPDVNNAADRDYPEDNMPDEDADDNYPDDDFGETQLDGGDRDAEEKSVFADNGKENELLLKQSPDLFDDVPEVTEIPKEHVEETNVTITYEGENKPQTAASENAAAAGGSIVIKFDPPAVTDAPAQTQKQPQTSAAVQPSGKAETTFTARYNGSIHTVDAFELVCMIVNNEISSYFNDEAIKAQAVAAYSYVKYHNDRGLTPSVLVKSNPPKRIIDMVSSVWGKCCYYKGESAQTVYMASSSGYTASSENVWGGHIDYLVSVPCPFDAESDPNYGVRTKFSEDTIRSSLQSYLGIKLSDNPSEWLKITGYVDGNYVSSVNVDGQKTISGRKLRENVLGYQLKSASFDITYSDGYFYFTTYGWGHGVGMSQNGANILAGKGYTYEQILKYYYTGIDVL